MLERVLAPLARRWAWVETGLRVQARFQEVHGGYLAAAITLTMFLSLFPLLLVFVAAVGLISSREMDLAGEVIRRLGLSDDAVTRAVNSAIEQAERSRKGASLIGVAGLLWSGLGVVAALQYAFDNIWQVSGRGLRDKLGGLVWLAGSGLILVASFALTVVVNFVPLLAPLTVPLGVVINLTLWLWTLKELTNVGAGWRAHLPGAVLGAVGLEVLKVVGAVYVPKAVASSSALYGSIGIVFAILAWLFLLGRLTVYSAALNVVRWEEEHGTVTAEIELPKHPDVVPVEATRAGEAKSPAKA